MVKLLKIVYSIFGGIIFLLFIATTNLLASPILNNYDSTRQPLEIRIAPYFWFVGFEGKLYTPTVPVHFPEFEPEYEIDVGFNDIKASIKWAMMINVDFDIDRLTFNFNLTSLTLEGEAITPLELVIQELEYRLAYNSGNFSVGYQFIDNNRWELEALTGFKFVDAHLDLQSSILGRVEVAGSTHTTWIEPLIGGEVRYKPIKRVELLGYADAGGIFIEDELSFQWLFFANFYLSNKFYVTGGYRYWEIIADRTDEQVYQGKLKGWMVKLGFKI